MSDGTLKALMAGMTALGLMTAGVGAVRAQAVVDPAADGSTPAPAADVSTTAATPLPAGEPAATAEPQPVAGAVSSTPEAVASLQPPVPGNAIPAAYLSGSARLPDQAIADWLADPKAAILGNPPQGLAMVNYVKSLVGSDNRTPAALIALSKDPAVTPAQQAAFGTGLARSAQTAQAVAPEYAAYILEAVATSESPRLITAFETALSQTATAALGAGGAAGAGAGGGGGSLGGGGAAGAAGAVGGDATVANVDAASAAGGGGSASFSEGDTLIIDGGEDAVASPVN